MSLLDIITRSRRMPLDERYAFLLQAKRQFKPRSIDMAHLLSELERVQFKRLRRDGRRAA
jgi:hypothetical protein